MPIQVQEVVTAVDELRTNLVKFDEVEVEVLKSRDVVAQAEVLSNQAREGVLKAIERLQEILFDIQRRYSKSSSPVPEVESSHEPGA